MLDEAAELLVSSIAVMSDRLGENHSQIAQALEELSSVQFYLGRMEAALEEIERALQINTRLFGPQHASTLRDQILRASLLRNLTRDEEAIEVLDAVIEQVHDGSDNKDRTLHADALVQRGMAQLQMNQIEPAWADIEKAIDLFENYGVRSPTHQVAAYTVMATQYLSEGNSEEVSRLIDKARAVAASAYGRDAVRTRMMISQFDSAGNEAMAALERKTRAALTAATAQFGEDHMAVGQIKITLGAVLMRQDNFDEAERLMREGMVVTEPHYGSGQVMNDLIHASGVIGLARIAMLREQAIEPEQMTQLRNAVDVIRSSAAATPRVRLEATLTLAEADDRAGQSELARKQLELAREELQQLKGSDAIKARRRIAEVEKALR